MTPFQTFVESAKPSSDTAALLLSAGRAALGPLFSALGYQQGAEVGVWTGEFSEVLCRANPSLRLRCVDPWQAYKHYNEKKNNQGRLDAAYAEAVARLAPFDCDLMRMSSRDAAAQVRDGSLDCVYIDGNHARAFVEQDLHAWVPKVRRGGIVAGHDYELTRRSKHVDVKAAVDAFTTARGIAPWYVLTGNKAPSFLWMVA